MLVTSILCSSVLVKPGDEPDHIVDHRGKLPNTVPFLRVRYEYRLHAILEQSMVELNCLLGRRRSIQRPANIQSRGAHLVRVHDRATLEISAVGIAKLVPEE